ncbi:MAG: metallophosphoesterase, partial [Dehalococcoidia bacterium]|nr:metallophosphoesterase [Dehalococcoidia bacterium]
GDSLFAAQSAALTGAGNMANVRVVLTADTHLGFDQPSRPRIERRRRGDDFEANFCRVLDHVLHTHPDLLVVAGDVFHTPRPPEALVDRTLGSLAEVAAAGIPVFVLAGNHDRSQLPPSLWLGHPSVHVFDKPRTFVLERGDTTVAIGGLPFSRRIGASAPDLIRATGIGEVAADLRLLAMHQSVDGARVGTHDFQFRPGSEVLRREALPRSLTAVVAGHVHRHQVLANGCSPPVLYPGSIERTSFAEREEPKGFLDISFRRADNGIWQMAHEFHRLPTRPMVDVALPATHSPSHPLRVRIRLFGCGRHAKHVSENLGAIAPVVLHHLDHCTGCGRLEKPGPLRIPGNHNHP